MKSDRSLQMESELGGRSCNAVWIEYSDPTSRFKLHQLASLRGDGVHMSELGMDIFLKDLQGGL